MTKEQWQSKKHNQDVLGVNVLKKTIDDYETKLCEQHATMLILENDNKTAYETINDLKQKIIEQKRKADLHFSWYEKEKLNSAAIKAEAKLLAENAKTKWYQYSTRKKIQANVEHFIRWGY